MPAEWTDSLPWKQIGAVFGSAVLVIGGGLWSKREIKEAEAPMTVQEEHAARHFDWQKTCYILGQDADTGAELRKCPDDNCLIFIVVRGGLRQMFFSVAPEDIPTAPMILGHLPLVDLPGGSVLAAYPATCVSDHGQPSGDPPFSDGADLGNGWIWQYMHWRDGCRMARQFHRPTQSATAWQWDRCAEAHR